MTGGFNGALTGDDGYARSDDVEISLDDRFQSWLGCCEVVLRQQWDVRQVRTTSPGERMLGGMLQAMLIG